MKILYVYADRDDEWNCAEWRIAIPCRAMNRSGRHTADMIPVDEWIANTPRIQSLCKAADVIVLQRNMFGPVLSAIQRWKARDKTVIVDFDDAYDLMPAQVVNARFWQEGLYPVTLPDGSTEMGKIDPPPLTQFKWGLRLVDAATVPSHRLVEDWRAYTQTIYLPNYLELDKYANITPESHDGIVIGWGGSASHVQSFTDSGVLSALERVCKARSNVKVKICGDPRVFQQLKVAEGQKIFQPWVPSIEWPRMLSTFDIGLAPLNGAYDERRSWIKALEYMAMKIPWVATDGVPYQELRSYGWLTRNTPSAWERVLLDMIDHWEDYHAEAAGEPYLFAISQGIDENIDKITSIYATIQERNQSGE